ncbi:MAG: EAL domain-containing protein [Ruminococcus sp.]|nr:EAL domain-containing protein [Ruminococcus sp.]
MINPHLLETIMQIISDSGIPNDYIEIELTETTTDVEFTDLKHVVGGLQQQGVFTSVDDFGIGYSSLNLIRAIPWNVLKVDKSFLPTAADDDSGDCKSSIMFKHVVAMARELGLECIAEGVETKEQVDILRENGCMIAQGFYFDKPLPIEEFEKRLENQSYPLDKE